MANPQPSPISQLLNSLGITREDLEMRSQQMRQFLTSDSSFPSRASSHLSTSATDTRPLSRADSSATTFTRQISRGPSISTRDASPTPAPTVKREIEEESIPPRQFDSMEMVLERQRLNRKQKRSKKRETSFATGGALRQLDPLPSQERAPVARSNDPRDDDGEMVASSSTSVPDPPPVTPMRSKYYREHTSYTGSDAPAPKIESPSPTRAPSRATASTYAYPYFYYGAYGSQQNQFLSLPFRSAQAGSSVNFQTPVKPRPQNGGEPSSPSLDKSPLPPSSPPYASSPASSPVARLINYVSSPGPMASDPPKAPPYKLPPGPYSDKRPYHSYAALIGQAILASEDHRLTLQEIYEYIVTVYPHFKRGERTWMNSIRHVLSTTVHFRKVTRERAAGRSHWAILDEDLHCFVDGNYRKSGTSKMRQIPRPKAPKKRSAEEAEEDESSPSSLAKKSAKRAKKMTTNPPTSSLPTSLFPPFTEQPPGLLPALVHPQEKPNPRTGPATHHQTYFESCMSKPARNAPSEILFPPLPKDPYRLIASNVSAAAPADEDEDEENDVESEDEMDYPGPPSTEDIQPSSPLDSDFISENAPQPTPSRSHSSISPVPALTPNCSSSSPIPPSDIEQDSYLLAEAAKRTVSSANVAPVAADVDDANTEANTSGEHDAEEGPFTSSLLRPVEFWDERGEAPADADTLQPGIELQGPVTLDDESDDDEDDDDDDVPLMLMSQTNRLVRREEKATVVKLKIRPLAKVHSEHTLQRRKTAPAARTGTKNGKRKKAKPPKVTHLVPIAGPSTPPRNSRRHKIHLSPSHTPLSHKGLYMSPSASLAHYKSHLDPPPTLVYGTASSSRLAKDDDDDDEPSDVLRTPARKRNAASSSAHPVTPKRLLFGIEASSPFRTPGGGMLSASPFRTPGGGRGGGIFDTHDPLTMLDEELSSFGAAGKDSPAGLYGKGTLYDSPNPLDGSPGKWARWW